MFSGIVEASGEFIAFEADDQLVRAKIKIHSNFNDLKIGDSLSVNGVCLTIEGIESNVANVTLGPETLKVTDWSKTSIMNKPLNLERSLRADDRVHGHFVLGHVDGMGEVLAVKDIKDGRFLKVGFSNGLGRYFWRKGSVAINGVSLTINSSNLTSLDVCLIPETLKRTNLSVLKVGDQVTLEVDSLARAIVHQMNFKNEASI